MMINRLNFVVLVAVALSDSTTTAVSGLRLRQRQDWAASVTSSSSYNYWWPYPPWGATTTTTATTQGAWTAPIPTTLWWTPPVPTPVLTSTPTPEVSTMPEESVSFSREHSSSPSSDLLVSTSSDSPGPTASKSTSPTTAPSASISPSSAQSSSRSFKPVYLISIFAVLSLVGGIGIAFYVTKRWEADQGRRRGNPGFTAQLQSGDADREKGITSYLDAEHRGPTSSTAIPCWSVQRYLPRFGGSRKYFKLGGPKTDPAISSTERPPFAFSDLLSSPDIKGTRPEDPTYSHIDPATYGYGQWRERSLGRYINPETSDLSRAYSREGDAKELEVDLSKGWRHYSSLYGGSPDPENDETSAFPSSIPPTKRYQRNLSRETTEALVGRADDKFTSFSRRDAGASSTGERQSFRGRAAILDRTHSDASSGPLKDSGSNLISGQNASAALQGPDTRRLEERCLPSYSSDEAEGFDTEGSTAAFSNTPRSPNGGIRHKSIRRILVERMNKQSEIHPLERSFTADSNPFSDSVQFSPSQLSADQMSLNDLPPAPMPLRVTSKRQDKPGLQSVSDVVREYDDRVRERKATGTEIEEDIGLSEVEALVEPPKRPTTRMNTKYRRTQQWLKDAPGPNDDITLARSAFLSRATTLASTIPSVYSPETDHASPKLEHTQSTDRAAVNGLGFEHHDASDMLSAAEMAKAARGRHTGDEWIKNSFPPNQRPKSPLPELPSDIMSPPLEANLFFSDRSARSSPPQPPSHPATATKVPERGQDNMPLKLKANRRLHSPRSSPLKAASPMTTRLLAAPAPTSNRLMGPHRSLARNATTVTTITNRSVTPPPSHFTSKARAEANAKVDMIVQKSWEAKPERPTSPTGFGAKSDGDVRPPAVLWRQSDGPTFGYSPLPDGVGGDGYAGGIEQRLALLR